jgi:ABC-type dipeptide/oligopeptide/nickel transport system permease component
LTKNIFKVFVEVILLFLLGSFFIFSISKNLPYDTAEKILVYRGVDENQTEYYQSEYEKVYKELGYDKPNFYFDIIPSFYYRNVNEIIDLGKRNIIKTNNNEGISFNENGNQIKHNVPIPKFIWNGLDNQYHHYLTKIMNGEFGKSIIDSKLVIVKVKNALYWSVIIMLTSLLISIILSISISYFITLYSLEKLKSFIYKLSIGFISIPMFLIAMFVLIYLTNDITGINLISIPLSIRSVEGDFFNIVVNGFYNYLPAVLCLVVVDILHLTRLLLKNIEVEKQKYYIEVLQSRNIPTNRIIKNHILPNSLLPFFTLIIGSIPTALAGTLVLELIFNIPGMGRLIYDSIKGADWNVVYAIVLLFLIISLMIFKFNDLFASYLEKRSFA